MPELAPEFDSGVAKTYSATLSAGVQTSATDVFAIKGSASRIVTIKALEVIGTRTTAGTVPVKLIKRSTANTGGGTASLVQFVTSTETANNNTAVITVASTGAGNLIVIGGTNSDNRTINSITDGTTSFTQATNAAGNNGSFRADLWYLLSSNSGKTTFTVTFSGTSTTKSLFFWEVSGSGAATFDNANRVNNGVGSSNLNTGATVTSVGPSFIAACICSNGTIIVNPTAGNEFTSGGGISALGEAGCSLITSELNMPHTPQWNDTAAAALFGASTAAFTFAGPNPVSITAVPHDSTNDAATASVVQYVSNPTLGTSVGIVRCAPIFLSTTTTQAQLVRWTFVTGSNQGITLRGANESLVINLGGTTIAGASLCISVEWEEST